jgi:predicted GNAT family acetyltransferase
MSEQIIDNPEKKRFELDIDGKVAFATYRREGGVLYIPHVESPPSLRGTGAAGRLMQGVTELARAQNLRIVPICSYAAAWMRRHRDSQDLLA